MTLVKLGHIMEVSVSQTCQNNLHIIKSLNLEECEGGMDGHSVSLVKL